MRFVIKGRPNVSIALFGVNEVVVFSGDEQNMVSVAQVECLDMVVILS